MDLLISYRNGVIHIWSGAARYDRRFPSLVLLSRSKKGIQIESVGFVISPEELAEGKALFPDKEYYFVDPLDAGAGDPEIAAKAIQHFCIKVYSSMVPPRRVLRLLFFLPRDRFDLVLRLEAAGKVSSEWKDRLGRYLQQQAFIRSISIRQV